MCQRKRRISRVAHLIGVSLLITLDVHIRSTYSMGILGAQEQPLGGMPTEIFLHSMTPPSRILHKHGLAADTLIKVLITAMAVITLKSQIPISSGDEAAAAEVAHCRNAKYVFNLYDQKQ